MIRCYVCELEKPESEFYSRNGKFVHRCKKCYNRISNTHKEIKRNLCLDYCTICNDSYERYDLACITKNHQYTENPKDYMILCHKCHSLFDSIQKNRNNYR